MMIYTYHVDHIIYYFINLFSTSSSLNLVGFRLLLSPRMWFCSFPLFSPLFRLSVAPLSHVVMLTSPSCFLVSDWCHRIHWTILLMICYILFSFIVFVDTLFCLDYCAYFHGASGPFVPRFGFGPRIFSVYVFIYFIESLSHFVLVIYFVLIFVKCRFIYLIMFHN